MKTTSADRMRKLTKRKEDDDFDIQAHLEKEKNVLLKLRENKKGR